MKNAFAIVLTEDTKSVNIGSLTEKRSVSALPMAGRYRLIDFTLSNLVNSGIKKIGINTQYNYSSLMDHLRSGKDWDLSSKAHGLYILPPFIGNQSSGQAQGTVDMLYGSDNFIRKARQPYVIITGANKIYNMTYCDAMQFHLDTESDITIIYNESHKIPKEFISRHTFLNIDENNRVVDIAVNPTISKGYNTSMDTYILSKSLLEELLTEAVSHNVHDFVKDVLIKKLDKLKISAYKFDGYVGRIDSVNSYYKNNMKFLDPEIREEIFEKNPVYTKIKDTVPTKYTKDAKVVNSFVADGCIIEGKVENSIIFRGANISKNAVVKNCIIGQDAFIGESCTLENTILDKEVCLTNNKVLIGQEKYPVIISKGAIV